ncbi:MAG: sigma 54-interacting transcriptional regulator [Myxococcota bacterium]
MTVPLGPAPSVLSRVADAHSDDDWMSREHATVRLDAGVVKVRDGCAADGGWKASANGTFLGDGADADGIADSPVVGEVTATPGQVVRTGRTLWMLVENPAAAPAGTLLGGISDAIGQVRDELSLVVAEVALRFERQKRVTQALLVTGARGTGKQVVAREAHRLLALRRGDPSSPFVDVPAPALADGTSAADLFGVVDKYATDVKGRPGYFERAHGGVLLIDEVADAPLGEQAKLLNVLEERQVTRLGGRAAVPFDCLVVAATNRDLDELVQTGAFRPDLLDRLSRFHVHLPSLAERPEDVLPIAAALFRRHGHSPTMAWEVALGLLSQSWPGSVRELDAFVERLIALARSERKDVIDRGIFERAARATRLTSKTRVPTQERRAAPADSAQRGQCPPREELLQRLNEHGWNKTEVGRAYGKHPRQITRWMEYLEIERPE